ncbi:hypothetical protein ACQP2T_63600 (plasmid) [Nonomuraea sp. CA-143628]|uniref:hypothetical protein n=1 Tax=Nonomuraea sp. CA-143628 TaxID=3239997 RepID=UPI003D91E15C
MGELTRRITDFESSTPVASHEAHAKYLDNLEEMLRAAAIMFGQDGQIGGTWLRKRRPSRGRFIHLRERIAFGRRTKAHGRHGSKALAAAADKVRDLAAFHREFVEREGKTPRGGEKQS